MELPRRKRIRLPNYDYSGNGAYFITICTCRQCRILGEIAVGQGLCSCRLSDIGGIVDEEILRFEARYAQIRIDHYVIMPNHIHLLLSIEPEQQNWQRVGPERQEQSPCPTKLNRSFASTCKVPVGDIICALKSITTKRVNAMRHTAGQKLWQYRFHDHIIRGEQEYRNVAEYIQNNPCRWEQDLYYSKQSQGRMGFYRAE